jgi:hypothetical protein
MASTKKRARSPEVDELSSTRQGSSNRVHQSATIKRRWRGPKDDRLKALQKLEHRRRSRLFCDGGNKSNNACAPQFNARAYRTAPAPITSPLQRGSGPTVPHSPPSLPTGGDEDGPNHFNYSPPSSHVPLGSGLPTPSRVRDNRALLRQTRHLDHHTSAWNERRNNQATQWKLFTIPRLMPIYLANRAATESGRLPPPPKPNYQCQCNKVALIVEMVTWDRKFSPQLLQLFANCILHQDPRSRYCPSASAIQLAYS